MGDKPSKDSNTSIQEDLNSNNINNIENFLIVWLNSNINTANNNKTQLRQIVSNVKIFTNIDQCFNFLNKIQDEKIFIILSDNLNEKQLNDLENLSSINSIYLLYNQQINKNNRKIKGCFTQIESIYDTLKQDVYQTDRSLTVFNIIPTLSFNSLQELDSSFTFFHLLNELLSTIEINQNNKKNFIEFCRKQYIDNTDILHLINEFDRNYNPSLSILWYTRQNFIYSILNKAFRTENIEIIFKMSFFIHDLIQQIYSKINQESSSIVYYGQSMLKSQFEKISQNNKSIISFDTFLITNSDRQSTLDFAIRSRNNNYPIGIIFQMKVHSCIQLNSNENTNNLLLFHTIFMIDDIKKLDDNLWEINLTEINNKNQELIYYNEYLQNTCQGSTILSRVSNFKLKIGDFNKAIELYTIMLEITSSKDSKLVAHIHHQLGFLYNEKSDLNQARIHYEKSIPLYLTYLPSNDPSLSNSYSNLAVIFRKQGDLNQALKYHQHALNIDLQASKPDYTEIASRYNNIGIVLRDQEKYTEALEKYQHALKLELEHLPSTHELVATTYNNIADIYRLQGDYASAIEYYQKTLDIETKIFSPKHPYLATTHFNIAVTLDGLNRLQEAIDHATQAVNISRQAFGSDNPDVIENQALLDSLRQKL